MRRFLPLLILPLLVCVTACRRPAPTPPLPAAATEAPSARPDVTVHHLSLSRGFHTVDVLVPTRFPPPRPAVVSLLGEEDAMLDAGLAVITFKTHWELLPKPKNPQPQPKNTVGKWLLASPTPRTIGQFYLGVIAANAEKTIPQVLDAVTALPDIDARRLAVAGTSTNGFTVLMALAAEPRLTAGVAIVACGDFHDFLHRSNLAMEGAPLDLDPEYDRWLHEKEPIRYPEKIVHASLLMVNGSDDQSIPASCARETARVFRRAFRKARASRRFRFVMLAGQGHNIVEPARDETLAWLRRWLLRR